MLGLYAMWAILQLRCGDGSCLVANSCPTLATPSTVAHQASLSMGFSSQDYWSGLPFPSPRDLPDSGNKPMSPASLLDSFPIEPAGPMHRLLLLWNMGCKAHELQ